ncbi:MAG TPA: hypothetical protein VNG12_16590 [Acidimicrobiales bacterium]|nr:hypothetical protein [Acidimicrobiales bacterium]
MFRVYAVAHPAEMVDLHSCRDWTDEVFVGPPVGKHHAPRSAADPELYVSRLRVDVGGPQPALAGPVDPREEPGLIIEMDAAPLQRVAVAIPLLVVDVAPPAAYGLGRTAVHSAIAHHTESLLAAATVTARLTAIHSNMLAKAT